MCAIDRMSVKVYSFGGSVVRLICLAMRHGYNGHSYHAEPADDDAIQVPAKSIELVVNQSCAGLVVRHVT